jgi:hypothetical protein
MNEPKPVYTLNTDEFAALVKQCVREELAERGYEAAKEVMSKADVAKLFGVTERSIQTWMVREGMPHKKGHGGRLSFLRDEVATWAKEHGVVMKGKAA